MYRPTIKTSIFRGLIYRSMDNLDQLDKSYPSNLCSHSITKSAIFNYSITYLRTGTQAVIAAKQRETWRNMKTWRIDEEADEYPNRLILLDPSAQTIPKIVPYEKMSPELGMSTWACWPLYFDYISREISRSLDIGSSIFTINVWPVTFARGPLLSRLSSRTRRG